MPFTFIEGMIEVARVTRVALSSITTYVKAHHAQKNEKPKKKKSRD